MVYLNVMVYLAVDSIYYAVQQVEFKKYQILNLWYEALRSVFT